MEIAKLMSKVLKLQIKTSRLVDEVFGGAYHSAFKGKGLEFAELKKYEHGDDYRAIDWKATAKFNSPFVKKFEEERELTILFVLDISRSMDFGSKYSSKKEIVTELSAILQFSALKNKDKLGAVFFDNNVKKYVKPAKGLKNSLVILRDYIANSNLVFEKDYNEVIEHILKVQKRKAVVFFISDFLGFESWHKLSLLNKKHDLICLRIKDIIEEECPEFFFGDVQSFNGDIYSVAHGDRAMYMNEYNSSEGKFNSNYKKYGIDFVDIFTHDDYIKKLRLFFKNRMLRRK
ncbi:MAG: DUF58 domain-containing protein [Candidatus Muirbacterium halophilum]|nr:DUF58 domain-containing protein [Candidatus Muirbacterium halophilum]